MTATPINAAEVGRCFVVLAQISSKSPKGALMRHGMLAPAA